jgi:FkbM family methyltransferase
MIKSILHRLGNRRVTITPDDNAPIVVIDVGCRWGFAEKFLHEVDEVQLYGFDPDQEECERLQAIYKDKRVKLVPLGLAKKSGNYTLYRTKEPACSSMYPPDKFLTENYPSLDCAKLINETVFKAESLNEWAHANKVQYVDYLKLDTQGSELDILQGSTELLESVRIIDLEVEFNPIYQGQPTFSEVDQFLAKKGFMLWNFSTLVHYGKAGQSDEKVDELVIKYDDHTETVQTRGGQLFWGDARYVKKTMLQHELKKSNSSQLARDIKLTEILAFTDLHKELKADVVQ